MKYKVGDRVLIRKDLRVGMNVPKGVVSDMVKMAGKTVTIERVFPDSYSIVEDEWNWSDEMIERKVDMTKDDLKTGDMITYRCGHFSKYVPLNNDLTCDDHDYDAVMVTRNKKVIWPEKEMRYITPEEAASAIKDKFGDNVRIKLS